MLPHKNIRKKLVVLTGVFFLVWICRKIKQLRISSFRNFIRSPKDHYRVLVLMPLIFFATHNLVTPGPAPDAYKLSAVGYGGGFLFMWLFFSGEMRFKMWSRFVIAGLWTNLFYLVFFHGAGGGLLYFQILAWVALTGFLVFAITGRQFNENLTAFQTWWTSLVGEKQEKATEMKDVTPNKEEEKVNELVNKEIKNQIEEGLSTQTGSSKYLVSILFLMLVPRLALAVPVLETVWAFISIKHWPLILGIIIFALVPWSVSKIQLNENQIYLSRSLAGLVDSAKWVANGLIVYDFFPLLDKLLNPVIEPVFDLIF